MISCVIIDDERESRTVVSNVLTGFCPDVKIAGEADGVGSGLALIGKTRPDVVFLDIRMNDGTAFDLLEQINWTNFHIVFITAYDQYAIRAIRFSAIDYILKPVDPGQLIAAIERIKALAPETNQSGERISNLIGNKKEIDRIALPTLNGYNFVKLEDIVRCEADNNYTLFYLAEGKKFLVTRTLKEYENLLSEKSFVRVHQSHLVNMNFVASYIKGDGGSVIMHDGSEVEVSRRKKEEFLRRML